MVPVEQTLLAIGYVKNCKILHHLGQTLTENTLEEESLITHGRGTGPCRANFASFAAAMVCRQKDFAST